MNLCFHNSGLCTIIHDQMQKNKEVESLNTEVDSAFLFQFFGLEMTCLRLYNACLGQFYTVLLICTLNRLSTVLEGFLDVMSKSTAVNLTEKAH